MIIVLLRTELTVASARTTAGAGNFLTPQVASRDQVTRGQVAAPLKQVASARLGFHSLRHDLQPKAMRWVDHGTDKDLINAIIRQTR